MDTIYSRIAMFTGIISFLGIILYKIIKFIFMKKNNKTFKCFSEILTGLFIVYMITLLIVTWWPTIGGEKGIINIIPFRDTYTIAKYQGIRGISYILKVYFLNVLMLVPFGFLVRFYLQISQKKNRTLLYGFILILIIEAVQYFFVPGRAADTEDLIFNLLGVFAGSTCAFLTLKICERTGWNSRYFNSSGIK